MNTRDREIPSEVLEAKKEFEREYAKIRDKVIANRLKYKGTKYEDCPPMIKEQFRFGVRNYQVQAELERLRENHDNCPRNWALYVAWRKVQKEK